MSTVGSKAEREQAEQRQLAAAELFAQKVPQVEIARRFGVTPQAVFVWRRRWLAEAPPGCAAKVTGLPAAAGRAVTGVARKPYAQDARAVRVPSRGACGGTS
jgi:transposase-like protein